MRSKHGTSDRFESGHPDLETAYRLSQDFVIMLAEQREADLDSWLTQAEHCGLPEFKKMAKGIRQDYVAVKAAFSSEWSNGQVEAQVNCLKRKPRIVFGRANFDLTRAARPLTCVETTSDPVLNTYLLEVLYFFSLSSSRLADLK
jgi:transposase